MDSLPSGVGGGGIIAFGDGCDYLLDGMPEEEAADLLLASGGATAGPGRKAAAGGAREAKAAMALRSHREAERRRRDRINAHLGRLRALVPSTSKLEKAALLAEVIERVKELKSSTAEISRRCTLPSDVDELRVEPCDAGGLLKVSLCCEDRPELLADLKQALRQLRLRTVRAEISTLGGRLRNVFVVSCAAERHAVGASVRQALQAVLDRGAAQVELFYPMPVGEKRRRFSSSAEPLGCSS